MTDHDVGRLDVTVDHSPTVSEGQGLTDLDQDLQQLRKSVGLEPVLAVLSQSLCGEGLTFDQLHGEVDGSLGVAAELVNRHDVGVIKLSGDLRPRAGISRSALA